MEKHDEQVSILISLGTEEGQHRLIIEKTNNLFMLKISGIWETDQFYGLTYKFVKINHR